ncbi:MAG: acyltransferase [Clostridia bacterium]|nr:acyltransferase [Clostridia bacterium]
MLIDLLFILLFLTIFIKIKIVKPLSEFNNDYMSKKSSNSYRGIFALIVILHHIAQRVSGGVLPPDFTRVGYLAVSVFFFLSGYGLQTKNLSDPTYSQGFLLNRIPTILIPYVIMSFIYWLLYALLGDVRSLSVVLHNFIKNGDPIVWFSWYVVSILVFYFAFYVLMKIFKSNRRGMIFGGILYYIIYVFICQKLSFGLWWYSTSLFGVLGIFWASYEQKILLFLKKYYLLVLLPCWVLFFVLAKYKWTIYWSMPSLWTELVLVIVLAFLFLTGITALSLKVRFGNRFLDFLGKISFEIYMVQGALMLLTKNEHIYINNDFYWAVLVLSGSFLSAFMLNKLFSFILKKYRILIENILNR